MARLPVVFALLLTLLLGQTGCSRTILQSSRRDATARVTQPNSIGYYLPKGLIKIKLSRTNKSGGAYEFSCESEIVPDPRHFYTLQYNPNIFSSDSGVGKEVTEDGQTKPTPMKIAVDDKGLLQSISASAEDKTRDVIKTLVEALSLQKGEKKYPGAAVAVPRSFTLSDAIEVSFDPDDAAEIKKLNRHFEPLGIAIQVKRLAGAPPVDYYGSSSQRGVYYRPCLPYLVTIKRSAGSPPEDNYTINKDGSVELHFRQPIKWFTVSEDIRQQIEAKFMTKVWRGKRKDVQLEKVARDAGLVQYTGEPNLKNYFVASRDGLVELHIDDPSTLPEELKTKIIQNFEAIPDEWVSLSNKNTAGLEALAQKAGLGLNAPDQGFLITKVFQLPNNSPVLSIDITRSAFVKKDSELTFTDGILTTYRISKPSQVSAGLDIPLDVAKALVALPTNLIKFQFDTTTQAKELAKAELQRAQAEKTLLGVLLRQQQLESGQTEDTTPEGRVKRTGASPGAAAPKTAAPEARPTEDQYKQGLEKFKKDMEDIIKKINP